MGAFRERPRPAAGDSHWNLTLYGADGTAWSLALAEVVRAWRPNAMDLGEKLSLYFSRIGTFISEPPRKPTRKGASSLPSSAPF